MCVCAVRVFLFVRVSDHKFQGCRSDAGIEYRMECRMRCRIECMIGVDGWWDGDLNVGNSLTMSTTYKSRRIEQEQSCWWRGGCSTNTNRKYPPSSHGRAEAECSRLLLLCWCWEESRMPHILNRYTKCIMDIFERPLFDLFKPQKPICAHRYPSLVTSAVCRNEKGWMGIGVHIGLTMDKIRY